jgi:poly(A) polymerase
VSPSRRRLAELLRRPRLARLLAVMNRDGEETRLVGGAVRNALIGRPVSEFDLASTALPGEVARRAEAAGFKPVPTGIEHGTVTVVVEGEPFEVTTLREDVETDGRRARVRFGRDFEADARRRDFTVNALSVGADGTLFDYTGGFADLEARRIRFIGDPAARIREDYLRILRFFRFHATYAAGPPDPEGLAAAERARDGLALLSPERIRAETLKLLAAPRALDTVAVMAEHGLILPVLGGAAEFGRLARAAAAGSDPVRRLGALAVLSELDADRLRARLRLSNDEHERLLAYAGMVARLKSLEGPLDGRGVRQLVAAHGVLPVDDALAAVTGEPRPLAAPDAAAVLGAFRSGSEPVPRLPLRGADLVAAGIPPGPRIGDLIARARLAWLAQGCPTGPGVREALLGQALDVTEGAAKATRV